MSGGSSHSGRPRPGAELVSGGARFCVFTDKRSCAVRLLAAPGQERSRIELQPLGDGYFEALVPDVAAGALYDFVVEGRVLPDPYARFLPHGVHGPAELMASSFEPRAPLPRRPLGEQVIYELHVGTFSEQGGYRGVQARLADLVELGVTTLELLPLAAFAGARGWGYDGVALYAPHAAYGRPDELRQLVDAAHALGLQVLLDVVYNHFGPSGNYLGAYAACYFSDVHTPWGNAPSFADGPMRDLVLDNARYWLSEFHFDGLRLDATHAIVDDSERHLLEDLATIAHSLDPARVLIAEDERNDSTLVTQLGLDALWSDDFHHQVRVTLTAESEGYYANYRPSAAQLADVINAGWLYTGQVTPSTGRARGTSAEPLRAEQLVYCIQNHDQIGNRALGERLSVDVTPEQYRAVSLLLLFLPMTPLLFMGQEWASSSPFLYFTDHDAELGALVREGRRREFAGFAAFADEQARSRIPDPQAEATFLASRLDWTERQRAEHAETLLLYRRALELRRSDPVLRVASRAGLHAEAQGDVLLVGRSHAGQQRLLALNFSADPVAWAPPEPGRGATAGLVLLASGAIVPGVLPACTAAIWALG